MYLWNTYLHGFPVINLFQGMLLWAIVAISYYLVFGRRGLAVSFREVPGLSDGEIEKLMKAARKQASIIKSSNNFLQNQNPFEQNVNKNSSNSEDLEVEKKEKEMR